MAFFDLKKLKASCPSDLKKDKVQEYEKALKAWSDQMPEHVKDCKLADVLEENFDKVRNAHKELVNDLVAKRTAKKVEKERKPYTDYELLLKDCLAVVTKYKADFDRMHDRVDGDYQKHLAEIMHGYKTCLEQITEAEKEMQIASLVVDKLVSTVSGLEGQALTLAKPKLREALARAEKAVKEVLAEQTRINLQNKERSGPLRQKMVEYKIDPELIVSGALSKMYTAQAKASNNIITANNRLTPIIKGLHEKLAD